MFPVKRIFFDLDGTLINSLPDLASALDQMMLSMNKSPPGLTLTGSWVGNGADRLIKRALTHSMDAEPEPLEFVRAQQLFHKYYSDKLSMHSCLYEGVLETLDQLKRQSIGLACITNKPSQFTHPLLQEFGLDHYFDIVICGDSLDNKKPHPEPLLYTAQQAGVALTHCLMVGDSRNDVEAARAAGCPVAAVSYGYNHGEDIRLANPDACVDQFADLLPLLTPVS